MRAVSLTLFISAVLAVTGPATGQAQSTTSAAKTVAKGSAGKKGQHASAPTSHAAAGVKAKSPTPARVASTKVPVGPPKPVLEAGDGPPLAPTASTALRDAPDGKAFATLSPDVTLEAVARERGWVRVRAEGWVKEGEVAPVDSAHAVLSAADLRADPNGARGKQVRWDVEVLAMATADPLRKGLNADEPYLLARGPGSESALLYVAIPPAMVTAARTLASQAPVPISLTAKVRLGRSEPVGVPILDAQSLARR
jgi:hypothetical protein